MLSIEILDDGGFCSLCQMLFRKYIFPNVINVFSKAKNYFNWSNILFAINKTSK